MYRLFVTIWLFGTVCLTKARVDNTLDFSSVDKLRFDFLNEENELWNFVLDVVDNGLKEDEHPEVELIRRFQLFGDKLHEMMPQDITHGLQNLDGVWSYELAYADLRGIYALYETFRRFQLLQTGDNKIPSPKRAWTDLAETILNDGKSNVPESLARIYGVVLNGLFKNVRKEVEGDMRCDSGQSPQQVLYNLYNAIALTELKGYSMIQFSYMVLKLYNEGNYTKEAVQQQERFESRTNSAVKAIKEAMQNASRIHYRCDPRRHVKGKTYEEITQLIQGYIQNEVDLNPDGTCRENCAEYKYTKSHGCYQNLYCRQQRTCKGKILNCQFIDSDMWICPASPQSNRRYEYVEYENKRTLGRNKGCVRGSSKVDSWWRWLFWHCSYCFCLCDEAGPTSDRFFNMRSVIANITQNRVVTGLRFTKQNRIIHLQIQEGQLLPYGKINQTTVRWVPVDAYKITDYGVHNEKDYHTMSWEKRAIDLDDLLADDGFLVTGVRFKLIGSHLNFEIYMTPFDYKNGVLLDPTNKSVWKDNPNTDSALKNPRKRLRLQSPDIPTQSPNPSVIDSETDQYVEFTNSDMDRDAAQTTVPFIDVQEVESLQPVPLSGAGIHHKGQVYFGGFVAPKIITYDYSKHLKPVFPEHDEEPEVN